MHRLSSLSRPLLSFVVSAPLRLWSPALARRVLPPMEVPNPPARHFSRFPHESQTPLDGVVPMDVFPQSRHRDGSIYQRTHAWKRKYRIAYHNETMLEPMTLTRPADCFIVDGYCMRHRASRMFQFFSLKLAKVPVDGGLVRLYGYIAVRDHLDPALNYVVNISRDDPIIVGKDSSINMAGPKRGIDLYDNILIEYDMKIKIGEQEKQDPQLIDGASIIRFKNLQNCHTFTNRIHGDCGAVDITAASLEDAVEATVEVLISEVQSSFSLCLCCFTSGLKEEIRIFDGGISEPCGLKRSVVAVVVGSLIRLKFKVDLGSSRFAESQCTFKASNHGFSSQNIKTEFALVSVKVTWSTLPRGH